MTCLEAESMVMPYIRGEISDEELEEFLKHIGTCTDCKEELEIYFTVDVGIRQLDSETGNYNIKGALESALEASRQRLVRVMSVKIARYSVTTLCVIWVLISILLQMRLWWQHGVF